MEQRGFILTESQTLHHTHTEELRLVHIYSPPSNLPGLPHSLWDVPRFGRRPPTVRLEIENNLSRFIVSLPWQCTTMNLGAELLTEH